MASLYDTDFHAWTLEQARRLRDGEPVDAENIAEELETLGRSEEQELTNRLAVLLRDGLRAALATGPLDGVLLLRLGFLTLMVLLLI